MPAVRDVGHVHSGVRRVAEQRRDQRHSRLGVVRAAALLEQRGLGDERGVAVEVEQLLLDALHGLCARALAAQLCHDLVVRVVVPEVVRRHDAEAV